MEILEDCHLVSRVEDGGFCGSELGICFFLKKKMDGKKGGLLSGFWFFLPGRVLVGCF